LPAAEKILDAVIESAEDSGLREIRGFALHDRGVVARKRGELDAAIAYTYEALSCYESQTAKDRALADLAATFFDLGLYDASRDANLVLAATAQESYTRWVAMLNLLEGAAVDRKETVFEQYRRELAQETLPTVLMADFEYYLGQGYRLFGHNARAEACLSRAIATASSIQANEVLIRAEQLLSEIKSGCEISEPGPAAQATKPSPYVAEVAEAIHEMRTLAGVAG